MAHRLIDVRVEKDVGTAVVVLHGGGSRQANPMVNPARGWDAQHTPVDDTHWARRAAGRGARSGVREGSRRLRGHHRIQTYIGEDPTRVHPLNTGCSEADVPPLYV